MQSTVVMCLLALIPVLLSACVGETTTPPAGGTLRVLMRTSGATLDGDGYLYRIGSQSITLAVQDTEEVHELPLGQLAVELTGLANNCRAFSPGPDSVTIGPEETDSVSLVVSCDSALRNVILYEHWTEAGTPEVWTMRPDGTGKQRFVTDAWDPAPTPTGTEVVYQSWNTARLSIIRADNDFLRPAVPGVPGGQYRPDVSPDGRSVVFEQTSGGPTRIYRANLDGTGILELTQGGPDAEPRWSPDGRFITFDHVSSQGVQVYRVPAQGGQAVPLTPAGGCCARWLPGGDRLLFFNTFEIGLWAMNFDGGNAGPLEGVPNDVYADWSPDGSQILMERVTDSLSQVWRVPLGGGTPVPLTDEGQNLLGRWLP